MENIFQRLVIMNENDGEFEKNISTAIKLLMNLGNVLVLRTEISPNEQVIIEYESGDRKMGGAYPYWLYPEEFEQITQGG